MLKLSKTSWVVIIVGIVVVAFASLGIVRYQTFQDQGIAAEELAGLEGSINDLEVEPLYDQQDELQKKLDDIILQREVAEGDYRQQIESIGVTDDFFRIAQASGVEVINLSTSSVAEGGLSGTDWSELAVRARVEGDVSKIIGFVIRLNSDFAMSIVNSAVVTIEETEGAMPTGDINMVVYSYQGL